MKRDEYEFKFKFMKIWQLNLLIAAYVAAYSSRYFAIKLAEEDQEVGQT